MQTKKGIGFEVKVLSNLIKRSMGEKITKTGVEGLTGIQAMIIGYLFEHADNQNVYQRDIENEFDIRRSTVTGVLQTMEKNNLVKRQPVEHDARLKKLVLTKKAIRIHEIITETIFEVENKMREGLTEEEITVFFHTLEKIKKNIQ